MTPIPNRRSRLSDLSLHECGPDGRSEVEALIKSRFRATYAANLNHLMPRLFTLKDGAGAMTCAFGLREASRSRLYMEQYLDQPVENAIADVAKRPVLREHVIEVGNLASSPGTARAMITALTRFLYHANFHWVVFTGVASLRAAFARLGLQPVVLAQADPARLDPMDLMKWGTYFAAAPQVLMGDIRTGYRHLLAAGLDATA